MTQLEQTKYEATTLLKKLCARCKDGVDHNCPVLEIAREIESLKGVPVIVNDRLWHVVFN